MIELERENVIYPGTAVTTWSGYVYQGKVALYHCLKLIEESNANFELQLDSSDDFAIYENNILKSSHQVKAKAGKYRSGYAQALEKAAAIEFDRKKGTLRYMHVSVQLDDTTDFISKNEECVSFYQYGHSKYCSLGSIEGLTKTILRKICDKMQVTLSVKLLNHNYNLLSEKITSSAMEVHRMVQEHGEKANKAAYEKRIASQELLDDLLAENPYSDTEYYAVDLKARLLNLLAVGLEQSTLEITNESYIRAQLLFDYVRLADTTALTALCHLMKPSERFNSLQKTDMRRYSELIHSISVEPAFNKIPHYLDNKNRFYLPTALDLPGPADEDSCTSDLLHEIEENSDLMELLFEYSNLISGNSKRTFTINTKYSNADDLEDEETRERIDSNITKLLCLSIVTKADAEEKLNAK